MPIRRSLVIQCVLLIETFSFSRSQTQTPVRTVDSVDLVRYSGTLCKIARLPNRFQNQCSGDDSGSRNGEQPD